MAMGLALVLALAIATVVVLAAQRRRRPQAAIAAVGRELTAGVPPTPAAIALLERWRDRAGRWRWMLAGPTVLATVVASVTLRSSIDVGVGAHPAWADPLLTGLLSVLLGAIAAELHHLRPRPAGRRTVELTPRDLADHLPAGARQRLAVLGALAVIATVLASLIAPRQPWLGLLALLTVGLVPIVQRRIVTRGRPAVAADLRAADDAVRRLAVRSVDEAAAGVAVLLTAWQVARLGEAVEVGTAAVAVVTVAQLAAIVLAIVWWRRSNPRRLLPDVPAALADQQPSEPRP